MVLTSIILCPLTLATQDVKPVSKAAWKSIEVKHFTNADGVQLSPNFSKYFYTSFLAELQRLNISEQVVEEGTPVNDTQGSHGIFAYFIVLEGKFAAIKEGRKNGDKFEAGSANIEIHFYRRSNQKQLSFPKECTVYNVHVLKPQVALNGSLQNDEQKVAEAAGVETADAVREFLYPEQKCKGPKVSDFLGW
jgi:hypothetical protein